MKQSLIRMLLLSLLTVGLVAICSGSSRAQSAGETLFKAKCAMCRGPDGKGEVPMGKKLSARNLGSTEVQGQLALTQTEDLTPALLPSASGGIFAP